MHTPQLACQAALPFPPTGHWQALADPAFNASFSGIGLHYEPDEPNPEVQAAGKT